MTGRWPEILRSAHSAELNVCRGPVPGLTRRSTGDGNCADVARRGGHLGKPAIGQSILENRLQRAQAGLVALAVGALALVSVFVPRMERVLNVTLGVGLGLLVVGWVIKQVLEEIQLRRCYDTPAQRAEAERKGAEARRERRAAAALAEATVQDEVVHGQGVEAQQAESHAAAPEPLQGVSAAADVPAEPTTGAPTETLVKAPPPDGEVPARGLDRAHRVGRGNAYRLGRRSRPRRLPPS